MSKKLKAFFGSDMPGEYALLIFATNRQEAKVLLNQNMVHCDYEYTDLRVWRAKDEFMLLATEEVPHVIDGYDSGEPTWTDHLKLTQKNQ